MPARLTFGSTRTYPSVRVLTQPRRRSSSGGGRRQKGMSTGAKVAIGVGFAGTAAAVAFLLLPRVSGSNFNPTVTVSPTSVGAGGTATLALAGFAAAELIHISIGPQQGTGTEIQTAIADNSGAAAPSITVPATLAAGAYYISAVGDVSRKSVSTPVTITTGGGGGPSITLAQATANPGGSVTGSYANFAPGETVTVTLGGAQVTTSIALTNGSGTFTFTVPGTASAGTVQVTCTGPSGATASAPLTITTTTVTTLKLDVRAYDAAAPTTPVPNVSFTISGGPEGNRTAIFDGTLPVEWTCTYGNTYTVTAGVVGGFAFSHWGDNSTNPTRVFAPTLNPLTPDPTSFNAFFDSTIAEGQALIQVVANDLNGQSLNMFTRLLSNIGTELATGPYTPCSFTVAANDTFQIEIQDYVPVGGVGYTFASWSDGSTQMPRPITPINKSNNILTARFNTVQG